MNHAMTLRALAYEKPRKTDVILDVGDSRSVTIERAGNKPSCDEQK
jgi:hypothetical protein